jgi:glycine/D-amino acid oxidase-like deaminating enzyme
MKEYPYWWDTVPALRGEDQKGEVRSQTWDVAIIGAGYTGLSAARHLARVGASVLVLERGHIGAGASSRNGGQVLTGLRVEPATLIRRYGERSARALFEVSLQAIARVEALVGEEGIDCEFERSGHIQAAWKRSHFKAFREEQSLLARVFNHRVELVSAQDQRSELGSGRYHGLLVDEQSAALNPARYVHGLGEAAARAGASIASGRPVSRLERIGTRWRVSTADGIVVDARRADRHRRVYDARVSGVAPTTHTDR